MVKAGFSYEYIHSLRLTSKLADLREGYANSQPHSGNEYEATPKQKTDIPNGMSVFLVEVAGLELAASSTRNWRATNCATPRNC